MKDLSVSADVDHVDLGSAKGTPSDIYVGTKDIAEQLAAQSVAGKIVALENMIDKKAMRTFVRGINRIRRTVSWGDMDFFRFDERCTFRNRSAGRFNRPDWPDCTENR